MEGQPERLDGSGDYDTDNLHPDEHKTKVVMVDMSSMMPQEGYGSAFTVEDNVYVSTSYSLTEHFNHIDFQIILRDGTKQTVTSSEHICVVKCKSKDICIYYIPKLFMRSLPRGPSIVHIKSGKITHHKSGVLMDGNTILTSTEVSDSSPCEIIFSDCSKTSDVKVNRDESGCSHILLKQACSDYTVEQWRQNMLAGLGEYFPNQSLTSTLHNFTQIQSDVNKYSAFNITTLLSKHHYKSSSDLLKTIEGLIENGADINSKDTSDRTPLMLACMEGLTSVINLLLDHGADVSLVDYKGNTVLHYIVKYKHDDIIPCIERIINSGININIQNKCNKHSPLMLACKNGLTSVINLLLVHGADVSLVDIDTNTVLHNIVKYKHDDIIPYIERLINSGININIQKSSNQSPLKLACEKGMTSVINLLLDHGADVNLVDYQGNTVLHIIVKNKHDIIPCIERIIKSGININIQNKYKKQSPLMIACSYGLPSVINLLLNQGADVSLVDEGGDTVLHYIVENKHDDIIPCIERIINSGININIQNKCNKHSPLMIACGNGLTSVINLLLDHGADVSLVDRDTNTVLHYIVENIHDDIIPCVERIINSGININTQNSSNESPLMLACKKGLISVINWLLDHGADVNLVDNINGNTVLHYIAQNIHDAIIPCIERIIKSGININIQNKYIKQSPLMIACMEGLTSVINLLLNHGADVSLVDYIGDTVLHYIAQNKHDDIIPCIERIINSGININIQNIIKQSPLMLACENGLTSVINFLLNHGADVSLVDKGGDTVLHYIVKNEHYDIIPCIERIINSGININIQNSSKESPLILACRYGLTSVINLLLDHGADVSQVDEEGDTVLHYIVKNKHDDIIPCIERIINSGININMQNNKGKTPIHKAVYGYFCDYNLVKLLINGGCNINIPSLNGRTPLYSAIIHYLKNKYKYLENKYQYNCLEDEYKYINITRILLDAGCDVIFFSELGLIVLLQIVTYRNKELIYLLIQYRADVLTQHEHNKLQLVEFILCQNDLDLLESSLQSGLYINTFTYTGDNIFHLFAKVYFEYSYYNYNWLLYFGLDMNHVNNLGNTPLMVAALLNTRPFIEFLIEQQCNVNIQNAKGHTALHMCVIGFTLIKETLSRNKINKVVTELCSFNYYPVYLQCVDVLLAAGADVNIQDNGGKTVLMLAASKNDRQLIQKLVNAGADVNMLDIGGRSALQYLDFYKNGCDLKYFKLLLSNGGHHLLNLPDRDGTTIIQTMMLFPPSMPVEQTCCFITFMVANNVSLYKLALVCDDNYYNEISVHELSSESRTVLRQLLFMSGAPRNEIMKALNFETEDQHSSVPGKLQGKFNSYCNNLSLKSLSRRIIRQNLGLGIQQTVSLLKVPQAVLEFILLKDMLTDKDFNIDLIDDCVDDDNYDGYDLDQDDEDCHGYNDKYYNQNLFYGVFIDTNDESDEDESN